MLPCIVRCEHEAFLGAQMRIVAFYASGSQLPLSELHAIN